MAQLGNLLVTGSSRLLGKLFCNDISVGNELTVKTLNTTDFTANSIITSGLTVNGNTTTTGTLNVGNSQANGKISINGKVVIRDYGSSWLGINDGYAGSWLSSGVYFGKSTIRTDTTFQLGENGNKILFNTSSAKFSIPVTINNSLAANNVTATNLTINDTLKAFKYNLSTIQDLGGEFLIAPTIYIQSGATIQVSKASSTTITVSILDKSAITSDIIQGVPWSKDSKIKFQGKIDGISIRCDGVMANKLNTTANTMALTLTVDSSIANHFATANNNASYSDISILLYQRYGKNISGKNTYSPVGIRMSATGSSNAAPYVDIWGSKSSSDSDVIYTIPSVRLGYLDGLSVTYDNTTVNCAGYGLYADNVYLNGTIISNAGSIGGFRITDNAITNGIWGTDKSVLVCTGSTTSKSVGGSASIADWCFTAGSKFGVTTSGDMYSSNAIISGKVTATSGTIGGCAIKNKVLQVASANITSVNADTITTGTLNVDRLAANSLTVDKFTTDNMVGTNGWINFHKGTFNYGNGNLVWDGTELSVNGTVTATAGDIGGCSIVNGVLQIDSANILSINADTIKSGTLDVDRLDVDALFAKDITATGTITGATIKGGSGEFTKDFSVNVLAYGSSDSSNSPTGYFKILNNTDGIFIGLDTEDSSVRSSMTFNPLTTSIVGKSVGIDGNSIELNALNGTNVSYGLRTPEIEIDKILYKGGLVGEIFDGSGTKNIATGTWANTGASITLSPGTYLLIGTNVFAASKGGRLGSRFANSSGGNNNTAQVTPGMTTSQTAWVQCQWIVSSAKKNTYYLQAFQQTGASLSVTGAMRAVRISGLK